MHAGIPSIVFGTIMLHAGIPPIVLGTNMCMLAGIPPFFFRYKYVRAGHVQVQYLHWDSSTLLT